MQKVGDVAKPIADRAGALQLRELGRAYLLVLGLALVLYGVSVAPGVLWGDSGMAQVRVLRHDLWGHLGLALSHPLYYLIAFAFQVVPLGESALRTNLVSVVFGAVTVANVYLLLRLTVREPVAAAVGTISLAVAHTFWQHCALAEVYTVSTALLTVELLCLIRHLRGGSAWWLVLLLAVNGLGVSNHLLALLNLPVWGILLLVLAIRRQVGVGTLVAGALAWLAGASPYLALVVAQLVAGEPAGDVLRSALFGEVYARNVLNVEVTFSQLGKSVMYLGLNFPTPAALLGLLGLAALRRLEPRRVALVLAALLVIHLLWAVRYDVPDQYTFFIPGIVVFAVWIGVGAGRLLAGRSRRWQALAVFLASLPIVVYIFLPATLARLDIGLGAREDIPHRDGLRYFLWPWKTGDMGAQRFAEEVLETLPRGSILLADGTTAPPLHYLQQTGASGEQVEVRPAVGARLTAYWPDVADVRAALEAGRVYVVSPTRSNSPRWVREACEVERAGPVYRVIWRGEAEDGGGRR
jgi:hypothetical protein